jgi:hypothetical protein
MANAEIVDDGATILILASALPTSTSDDMFSTIDGPPLSERQIVDDVSVLSLDQASHMGRYFTLAQRVDEAHKTTGMYKVVVCVWPDLVAAVLAFDPAKGRPRANQLIRSYYGARAGILLALKAGKKREGKKPC